MNTNGLAFRALALGIPGLLTALSAGCGSAPATIDGNSTQVAAAIEQPNGGMTMVDEAPDFGRPDLFTDPTVIAPETSYQDSMATDPAVTSAMADPNAAVFKTLLVWGQMPANPNNPSAHDWSGTLSVNRGAIIVKRTIGFENTTDAIAPRTDKSSVTFTSVTKPFVDGLRLVVIDPDPSSSDPFVLTYTPKSGAAVSAPMSSLVGGPHTTTVDSAGDRVIEVASPEALDVCQHGFLRGRWHKLANGRGVILGRVADADGNQVGAIKGLYGQRKNGEKVFFAKYIDNDGHFRGILAGHYDSGHFLGRWITKNGEHGHLGGVYRESAGGSGVGGRFLGRWAETSCNLPTGAGAPVPGESTSP